MIPAKIFVDFGHLPGKNPSLKPVQIFSYEWGDTFRKAIQELCIPKYPGPTIRPKLPYLN